MKIEITFTDVSRDQRLYHVAVGERWADELTYQEMLVLLITLTAPKSKECLKWLKTQEEFDDEQAMLRFLHKKQDDPFTGVLPRGE